MSCTQRTFLFFGLARPNSALSGTSATSPFFLAPKVRGGLVPGLRHPSCLHGEVVQATCCCSGSPVFEASQGVHAVAFRSARRPSVCGRPESVFLLEKTTVSFGCDLKPMCRLGRKRRLHSCRGAHSCDPVVGHQHISDIFCIGLLKMQGRSSSNKDFNKWGPGGWFRTGISLYLFC